MGSLRDDLSRGAERVWETHISWVVAHGDEVVKIKKPVDLGFLDFTTAARRRAACEAEVVLNARLSPDVYRGVVPITRDDHGVHHVGGDGEIVDWAVKMRRLADRDRADERLARGALQIPEVDRMAVHVARFHEACRADEETARHGHPDAIRRNVEENFAHTRGALDALLSPEDAQAIEAWQLDFLDRNGALFERRQRAGRVRDGHGDLRLEHFYLERRGAIRVIDCIEFNERFRFADVAADLAFLSMDLAWHGRVDLAERALAVYARETNDFDLYAVIDFYESYRAYVRGKIATMLASDPSAPLAVRDRAEREARRYFLLALAAERRPLLEPMLVAVGGPIASGKTTLSDALGAAMGAPAINTDRIRKHMMGARATDKLYDGAWSGAYDPSFTERVYDEVARLAKVVLASRRPVILDASFRSRKTRDAARRVAEEAGVPFRFVECRVDPDVCRARLRDRDMKTSVSDGRLAIFDDFLTSWEPVDELPHEAHVVVDTTRPFGGIVERLRGPLSLWPRDLTA